MDFDLIYGVSTEAVISDQVSGNGNEETLEEKEDSPTRKRTYQAYNLIQTFPSKQEAETFIKTTLSTEFKYHCNKPDGRTGVKTWYYCTKQDSCQAKMYLLLPNNQLDIVKLFRSSGQHTHGEKAQHGIHQKAKNEITRMFKESVTAPKSIHSNLLSLVKSGQLEDEYVPDMTQLRNFLTRLRRGNKQITTIGQLEAAVNNLKEAENEDSPFVSNSYFDDESFGVFFTTPR